MPNIKETATKTRDFIKRLQRADDKTKRRYLYGVSAVLMIVVVFLWLVYLNMTLPQAAPEVATATSSATTSFPGASGETKTGSFFGTLGRGFGIVWQDLGSGFQNIGNVIGGAWQDFQNQIQRTNTLQLEATSTTQ